MPDGAESVPKKGVSFWTNKKVMFKGGFSSTDSAETVASMAFTFNGSLRQHPNGSGHKRLF